MSGSDVSPANPFRPEAGARPPFLAGRESETARLERAVFDLARGRTPSQGFLLYGPLGTGKTALLAHVADRARELEVRCHYLPPMALEEEAALISALQGLAGVQGARITSFQVGPVGGAAERPPPTADVVSLLSAWIRRERRMSGEAR